MGPEKDNRDFSPGDEVGEVVEEALAPADLDLIGSDMGNEMFKVADTGTGTEEASGARQSELLSKCSKKVAAEELSINAKYLARAGFTHRLMAGVYTMLPLGNRVLHKIEGIVKQEMAAVGASEITMPALQPAEPWAKTGRWESVDILYKLKGAGDRDLVLGPTHEEVVAPLASAFIDSYRDLPSKVFQIQTKFRNEARAKSGLLRGREFRMKDLYSFHENEEDLSEYYDQVAEAYRRIFQRCGIGDRTVYTAATGGPFSKYSHEFQTLTEYGEDQVYQIPDTDLWVNHELLDDRDALRDLGLKDGVEVESLRAEKAIEVGNIFKLGTKFSEPFDLSFTDADGKRKNVIMGCYGLGTTRVMGTVVECMHDEAGILWPDEIAPYQVHLLSLTNKEDERAKVDAIYHKLLRAGVEVLYDDRERVSPGQKFAEADLIGIPNRVVVGKKSLESGNVEWKRRDGVDNQMLPLSSLLTQI